MLHILCDRMIGVSRIECVGKAVPMVQVLGVVRVPATFTIACNLCYYICITTGVNMGKVIKHNFLKSSDRCGTSWNFPVAPNKDQRNLSRGMAQVTMDDYKAQLRREQNRIWFQELLNDE